MEKEKVQEMLEQRFQLTPAYPKKRHILFWYDEQKSFENIVSNLELKNVKILTLSKGENRKGESINTNLFRIKYTLEVLDQDSHFLIYAPFPKPINSQNYLLDIEYYSEFFQANKSAMISEELKLDRTDFKIQEILQKYSVFFESKERKEKLLKKINFPEAVTSYSLEMAILAVITGSKSSDILEILRNIILSPSKLEQIEKWMGSEFFYQEIAKKFNLQLNDFQVFLKQLVVVHFYHDIQQRPHSSLEVYYKGKTNDLYIFAESLLQNKQSSEASKEIFRSLTIELGIKERIDEMELEELIQGTSFEYFDKISIQRIAEQLNAGISDFSKYKKYIEIRLDTSLWKEVYQPFYQALLFAIHLLEHRETLHFETRNSLAEIWKDYTEEYYKIDLSYRKFYFAYDQIKSSDLVIVLDELHKKISYFYETEYLETLLKIWNQRVEERFSLPQQHHFYQKYIENSDTRVAVVISDALRYEVADEIAKKLAKEVSAKEIRLSSMITDLPSITSVGMANLLPGGEQKQHDFSHKKMTIHGINTFSTENRDKILKQSCIESSAIVFDQFKKMTRAEQEDYIKGKKIIYVYHDSIDAIGDKAKTEHRTFDACETAIFDITGLAKILSSLGVVNTYITSDHGFLYERKEIEEYNKLDLHFENYLEIKKRYAISKEEVKEKACISLKLEDVYGIFPLKNQRIKIGGSGLQFVHGGTSPQEMIVPLIHYRSGVHAKKSSKVSLRIKETVGKITSHFTKFAFYQMEAVNIKEKKIEREVVAALYDADTQVSNEYKVRLNAETENQEYPFHLTLSGEHEKVTLQIKDAETGELLDFKDYDVKIGMISDFDF